jgi:hypothetical protein
MGNDRFRHDHSARWPAAVTEGAPARHGAPLPSTPADQACQSGVHAGAAQGSRLNVCIHRFGDRPTSATRLADLTPASDLLT